MTTSYVSLTQVGGSFAINFAAGKNYKTSNISGITFTANANFAVSDTTAATLNAHVTAGDLTITSGQATFSGLGNLQIQIATESTGLTLQLEQVVAQTARNDAALAKKVNTHTSQITQLQTDVAAKAAINDADATSTTTTLSGSKISQLVSDAQSAAQNYASTAASSIIDDASTANDKVWSASKTASAISDAQTAAQDFATTAINNLIGGASGAADTLKELETLLTNEVSAVAALTTSVGNKVSFTVDQSATITSEQKAIARTNIGATSTDDVTNIANDRIAAVVGDQSAVNVSAIFASLAFTLA